MKIKGIAIRIFFIIIVSIFITLGVLHLQEGRITMGIFYIFLILAIFYIIPKVLSKIAG